MEGYTRIKENQKQERDEMIRKYQRQKLISTTPTLELSRALREAQVLGERQKEIEYRQTIKEKEKELERKDENEQMRQWEISNIFHRKKEESRKCKLNEIKTQVLKQYDKTCSKFQYILLMCYTSGLKIIE